MRGALSPVRGVLMANGQTKQPFTVTSLNLVEINDSMHRLQEELDRVSGLRGTVKVYNSVQYVDDYGQIIHGWGVKP